MSNEGSRTSSPVVKASSRERRRRLKTERTVGRYGERRYKGKRKRKKTENRAVGEGKEKVGNPPGAPWEGLGLAFALCGLLFGWRQSKA
jgi:hypothetical protein